MVRNILCTEMGGQGGDERGVFFRGFHLDIALTKWTSVWFTGSWMFLLLACRHNQPLMASISVGRELRISCSMEDELRWVSRHTCWTWLYRWSACLWSNTWAASLHMERIKDIASGRSRSWPLGSLRIAVRGLMQAFTTSLSILLSISASHSINFAFKSGIVVNVLSTFRVLAWSDGMAANSIPPFQLWWTISKWPERSTPCLFTPTATLADVAGMPEASRDSFHAMPFSRNSAVVDGIQRCLMEVRAAVVSWAFVVTIRFSIIDVWLASSTDTLVVTNFGCSPDLVYRMPLNKGHRSACRTIKVTWWPFSANKTETRHPIAPAPTTWNLDIVAMWGFWPHKPSNRQRG